MKNLYIGIINRFNISPCELSSFDLARSSPQLLEKVQSAFAFFKERCGTEVTFMQFSRTLEKVGREYGHCLNQGSFQPLTHRPFIFVAIYNMKVLLIRQNNMYSVTMVTGFNRQNAVNQFRSKIQSDLGVVLKGKCSKFKGCCWLEFNGVTTPTEIFVCPLSESEFREIEQNGNDVAFRHLYDPCVMFNPFFSNQLCGFIAKVEKSVKRKAEFVVKKPIKEQVEKIKEEKVEGGKAVAAVEGLGSKLEGRFGEFERRLDSILSRCRIPGL